MTETEGYLALNALPRIGPVRIRRLLERFGGPAAVLAARPADLLTVSGIGADTAAILHAWQDHTDPAAELAEAQSRGLTILTETSADYPAPLRAIYDAPVVLYVWGALSEGDRHAIGVVGSRKTTHYGLQTAKKFAFQLAHAGLTVLSGLARGIDTAAHEGALAANGRTVAVLGSGLGQLYPPENLALAEKIASGHGAVVSEFPIHTPPDKQTFPMRNRIVAGWGRGVLVVECAARSGALITANLAGDYGRQIYAVPGPITSPNSAGCHQLIRQGATLVSAGEDILEDFQTLSLTGTAAPPSKPSPQLAGVEAIVFAALGSEAAQVDSLVDSTGLPPATVATTLLKLEMLGIVRQLPGFRYCRDC
jgi:DNA processing protein